MIKPYADAGLFNLSKSRDSSIALNCYQFPDNSTYLTKI